jgi:HTH-type transcriptional regulator / antitoxin HigA
MWIFSKTTGWSLISAETNIGSWFGSPEGDRLEILLALVNAYDAKHWRIEPADPITTIKWVMTQTGRSQKDLAELLGSKSRASEIMNRRRHLTIEAVWKLSKEWKIPADTLVQPYDLIV